MSLQKAMLVELFAILLVLFGFALSIEVGGLPYLLSLLGLVSGALALFFGLLAEA